MKVFFYFFIFILIVGGLAQYNNFRMNQTIKERALVSNNNVIDSNYQNKLQKTSHYGIWYMLLFLGFFLIQGLRYYVGTDYSYYLAIDVDWQFVLERFKALDEPLTYFISYIARSIWDQPLMNILATSFIITFFVFYGIKQYDDNHLLASLLLYFLIGGFLFSLNGVMQAMAISFIFAFSKKAKKHWILKYVIVIGIAYLFHKSALMIFPILILSQFKINKHQMVLISCCAVIFPMLNKLGFEFMGADGTLDGYITEQINPLRILVAFAPLVLLFFVDRKKYFEENYFCTNMVIFNALLNLSTYSSAYLNRITRYSVIYLILFIPKCLKEMPKKSRIISSIIIYTLYCLFTGYEILNSPSLFYFHWIFNYM